MIAFLGAVLLLTWRLAVGVEPDPAAPIGGGQLPVGEPSEQPGEVVAGAPEPSSPDSAGGLWLTREAAPLEAPGTHRGVWTGDALLAWGGDGRVAAYHLRERRWRPPEAAPTGALLGPVLAWTGAELLVWGGQRADGVWVGGGAALEHRSGTWRVVPEAPEAIRRPVGVWSGQELLVWGAPAAAPGAGALARPVGLAFDPEHERWRRLEAAPIESVGRVAGLWTGRALLVWGEDGEREPFALAYEAGTGWRRLAPPPLTNPARAAAAWAGEGGRGELVLWGRSLAGQRSGAPPAGAALDPGEGRWRVLPPAPGYDWTGSGWGVQGLRATWTGTRVVIVGGYPRSVTLAYEPATDSWLTLPELDGIIDPVLEWTGAFTSGTGVRRGGELLLWGGYGPYGPTVSLRSWRTVGIGPTGDARLNTGP